MYVLFMFCKERILETCISKNVSESEIYTASFKPKWKLP